jgi:hypothetical protein
MSSPIDAVVKNANTFLTRQYPSFRECVWNEEQKCLIYEFTSAVEAEQFEFWLQLQGSQFRTETHTYHANLTVVRQFRP